jgi:hypothetical protein
MQCAVIATEPARYIVRQIKAQIKDGNFDGNALLIPRVELCPTDASQPFTLKRRQFPVRPAFAMSINKARGQALQRVGVLLDEPVFTHVPTCVRRTSLRPRQYPLRRTRLANN